MDILGIGIPELVFIVLIALVILGPREMQKTAQAIGQGLRKFMDSDTWRVMRDANREIKRLPVKLMQDVDEAVQGETGQPENRIGAGGEVDAWTGKPRPAEPPRTLRTPETPLQAHPKMEESPAEPAMFDEGDDA